MNKKQLRRISQSDHLGLIAAFERQLIHMTGAWICRLRQPEAKYLVTRHLFEWAEHVDDLRKRLKEMPGGKPDKKLAKSAEEWLHECMFAEDEYPFLAVMYELLIPELKKNYQAYLEGTAELPDRPTVQMVNYIISSLDQQLQSGKELSKQLEADIAANDQTADWKNHISNLLQHIGGITGSKSDVSNEPFWYQDREYTFPEVQHRQKGSFYSYEHPIEDYDWSKNLQGDPDLERVALAVWLYNEMDASEYIPTVLYEIKGMPWEFYFDVARHTWDEARHSEFGYTLLKQLGFDPLEFEVWVATYMSSMKLTPLERYTAVTCWYEPGSFQVKPDYLERVAKDVGGDDLVVELLKFDLADETLHVSFGHKWVQALMDHYGVTKPKKQFVDEVMQKGNKIREEQEAAFVSTMPKEKRHTMASIKKHVDAWAEKRGSRIVSLKPPQK